MCLAFIVTNQSRKAQGPGVKTSDQTYVAYPAAQQLSYHAHNLDIFRSVFQVYRIGELRPERGNDIAARVVIGYIHVCPGDRVTPTHQAHSSIYIRSINLPLQQHLVPEVSLILDFISRMEDGLREGTRTYYCLHPTITIPKTDDPT